MTDAEWQSGTDPTRMLAFLQDTGRASDRKLRLWACACVRRVLPLRADRRSREAVEVAEAYTDGRVAQRNLHAWGWLREQAGGMVALFYAWDAATTAACYGAGMAADARAATDKEKVAAWEATFRRAWGAGATPSEAMAEADGAVPDSTSWLAGREAARTEEREAQARLVRDLFGPLPFRAVTLAPACRTPGIVALATAIYEAHDFARLPDLAAVLEAAGCTDAAVLGHLRGPGPHTRGCWALDLILERS
jgi:hypothetical protein